jgi:hypothetical protein
MMMPVPPVLSLNIRQAVVEAEVQSRCMVV